MTGIKSDKELQQALSSLPREISPHNDVWADVSARISERNNQGQSQRTNRHGNQRWWPAAIAASLTVALIGGFLVKQFAGEEPRGNRLSVVAQPSENTAPENEMAFNDRLLSEVNTLGENEYQAAFREFLALESNSRSPEWPGIETFGSGWVTLQQAEIELAQALRREPENRVLNSRMAALRARQLDLLQQIAAMEMASRRNTT